MPLYPSNDGRILGWNPLRLSSHAGIQPLENNVNRRVASYAGDWQTDTASYPNGTAPNASIWLPLTAGGMSARAVGRSTWTANMLSGGPMSASFSSGITASDPSMSLVVSMSATWTAGSTWDANLRMTVGMEASFASSITGTANLAMIVPMGSATFTSGISGTADLKGNLSMSASFGGAEPLSPEGLARAVWEAVAADYNTAGTMGEKMNGAGSAGNPWTEVIDGKTAAQLMAIMAAALAGKTSGQPGAPVFRAVDDSADRISATVDASGNRTSVTITP